MKTSDLTGAALDWAVCSVEGEQPSRYTHYSTDWSAGGPIIEREITEAHREDGRWWVANSHHAEVGPTLLIAAMRCYVASKLGDEVEIPQELIE